MVRQGRVFSLEIGRLCLFTQRKRVVDMVGNTDVLVASRGAELCSDITQNHFGNKCQICYSEKNKADQNVAPQQNHKYHWNA